MRVERLRKCLAFVLTAPRAGVRAIAGMTTDRAGTAMVDYALLAGLVALTAAAAFQSLGIAVHNMFDMISIAFVKAMP